MPRPFEPRSGRRQGRECNARARLLFRQGGRTQLRARNEEWKLSGQSHVIKAGEIKEKGEEKYVQMDRKGKKARKIK